MAADGYGLYFQNEIHDWLFGKTAPYAVASTKYIALSITAFNPDGSGFTEVPFAGGTDYARAIALDATAWGATSDIGYTTQTTNIIDIEFPESGTLAWGDITSFAVVDDATAEIPLGTANIFFGGNLDSVKPIDTSTVAVFSTGNLVLQTKNTGL